MLSLASKLALPYHVSSILTLACPIRARLAAHLVWLDACKSYQNVFYHQTTVLLCAICRMWRVSRDDQSVECRCFCWSEEVDAIGRRARKHTRPSSAPRAALELLALPTLLRVGLGSNVHFSRMSISSFRQRCSFRPFHTSQTQRSLQLKPSLDPSQRPQNLQNVRVERVKLTPTQSRPVIPIDNYGAFS